MQKYLIVQQFLQFLNEANLLPYMVVQTQVRGTHGIPEEYIKEDGRITLNLSGKAALDLRIGIYQCQAQMMFNGVHADCVWHPEAIEAVYSPTPDGPKLLFGAPAVEETPPTNKPTLRIVK